MTAFDRKVDSAVRKAVRRYGLEVESYEESANSYLLSNDCCLLNVFRVSDEAYSVCAVLAENAVIKDMCGLDPYRFYMRMIGKIPFFSMKLEDEEIVYSVVDGADADIGADIDECVLVSKMFNATFEDVVRELGGKKI